MNRHMPAPDILGDLELIKAKSREIEIELASLPRLPRYDSARREFQRGLTNLKVAITNYRPQPFETHIMSDGRIVTLSKKP